MIVTAMIMAIQRLRAMTQGGGKAGKLARWTISYYVLTTIIAVAHSCILVGLVWSKLMQQVSGDQLEVAEDDQETIDERKDVAIHAVVVDMFNSLVPENIVDALATDSLLAVLVTAVVIGYVIKPGGALMKAVEDHHHAHNHRVDLPCANWSFLPHYAKSFQTRYRGNWPEPWCTDRWNTGWYGVAFVHHHTHHLFHIYEGEPLCVVDKV
jgi:hypothetical protein